MARPLQLETFDMAGPAERGVPVAAAEIEDLRLGAYEQGYAAGWDDAIAAQDSEVARLRTDLGRNLLDMSLSYRDARRHVLAALEPLLREMVTKVLPSIAHRTLGQIVLEELRPIAEGFSAAPVTVITAPVHRQTVEAMLAAAAPDLAITVREEPALGEGQAYLKLGASEVRIDLDGVIEAIGKAVNAFFRIETDEE
jgi:flagellar assembly protein FliH